MQTTWCNIKKNQSRTFYMLQGVAVAGHLFTLDSYLLVDRFQRSPVMQLEMLWHIWSIAAA
jgi:hypothetical protein